MIAKMRGMKRKLTTYADEETRLYKQLDARVAHLRELSDMHSVDDIKYEEWSRKRLDRLLVDYMLRHGYNTSAQALTNERDLHDLVDVETFLAMSKIRESLENGSVTEALAWCNDNKKELRKLQVGLRNAPTSPHNNRHICTILTLPLFMSSPTSNSSSAVNNTSSSCALTTPLNPLKPSPTPRNTLPPSKSNTQMKFAK